MNSRPIIPFVPSTRRGSAALLGAWLFPFIGACAGSGADEGPMGELVGDESTAVSNSSVENVETTTPAVTPTPNPTSVSQTSATEESDVSPASSSNAVGDTESTDTEVVEPGATQEPEPTDPSETSTPVNEPSPPTTAIPQLPPISGTCPEFETGTATIGGLGGIALQVGPKQNGTGSLVFYWHGTGSSASEVNTFLPRAVRQEILDAGGIIVSFDDSTGTGGDCSGTSTFSKDDFEIADLIAACAVRDHGIDPARIYSTGCSAGGLQAGCMGALRSSYIAAVAPNSGGVITRQPIQDPAHTPAVMTMHGGSSDVVVVAFSRTSATLDAQMKEAGSFVVNCDHGGGHCRAPSELYSAAWEFMKAHPFGVEPSPFAQGLPASFPDYCTVY